MLGLLILAKDTRALTPIEDEGSDSWFELRSPQDGAALSTNTVFIFTHSSDFDPSTAQISLENGDAEAVTLIPTASECGYRLDCMLATSRTLQENSEATIRVQIPDQEEMLWSFTVGPDSDALPPVLGMPTITQMSVQGLSTESSNGGLRLQRVVEFAPFDVEDANLVFGLVMTRTMRDRTSSFRQLYIGYEDGISDVVDHDAAYGEQCYVFSAYDSAGNVGETDPICRDLTITDEEAAAFEQGCSASGRASNHIPIAVLAAVLAMGRTRHRRSPHIQA